MRRAINGRRHDCHDASDGVRPSAFDTQDPTPRVWAILEERAGDDAQLRNLAEKLGWPVEYKTPRYSIPQVIRHRLNGTAGAIESSSGAFQPPWPDLILTIGGRSVVAACRIKAATLGRTRVVCLGRPWAPLAWFDLVVTTPQYRLPDRPNVLQIALPLNCPPAQTCDAEPWSGRLRALAEPFVALLVGGNNGTYVLSRRAARDLAHRASDLAGELGGSVLLATGPRTPAAAAEVLRDHLTVPKVCYLWHAERAGSNPYPLFVTRARHLIVTGDSASMLADACSVGGQVHLYDLPASLRTLVMDQLFPVRRNWGAAETMIQRLTALGWWFPRKDLTRIHEHLLAAGRITRLGEPSRQAANVSEMDLTVRRIRELMQPGHAATSADTTLPAGADVVIPATQR